MAPTLGAAYTIKKGSGRPGLDTLFNAKGIRRKNQPAASADCHELNIIMLFQGETEHAGVLLLADDGSAQRDEQENPVWKWSAVPLLVCGVVAAVPPAGEPNVSTARVALRSFLSDSTEALVMGPTGFPDPAAYPGFIPTVEQLYLDPLGFDGSAAPLTISDGANFGPSVTAGAQSIVNAVLADYNAGDMGCVAGVCSDPLTLFGYSQSAVDISLAENTLAADGVPTGPHGALDIVLVGDTSSAFGGFLTSWGESPLGSQILDDLGWQNLVGATTPANLYPTDVYTLTGDTFADYPNAAWDGPIIHTDYLGLTASEISSATLSHADGLTDYFTIADPLNIFETAITALLNITG